MIVYIHMHMYMHRYTILYYTIGGLSDLGFLMFAVAPGALEGGGASVLHALRSEIPGISTSINIITIIILCYVIYDFCIVGFSVYLSCILYIIVWYVILQHIMLCSMILHYRTREGGVPVLEPVSLRGPGRAEGSHARGPPGRSNRNIVSLLSSLYIYIYVYIYICMS